MTLNDLERLNSLYFAFFLPNSTAFQADFITVVEDRPITSVKYCLPVPVFYFWRKLQRTLQRGLSAIAEHLVFHIFLILCKLTYLSAMFHLECDRWIKIKQLFPLLTKCFRGHQLGIVLLCVGSTGIKKQTWLQK